MDLDQALREHYLPKHEARQEAYAVLFDRGFAHILRWACMRQLVLTGVPNGGDRKAMPPSFFMEELDPMPATSHLSIERDGVWTTWYEVRVSRSEIIRIATVEHLLPQKPAKILKPEALEKWRRQSFAATGIAPTLAEIAAWARANNCPIRPTQTLARTQASNTNRH